MVDIILGKLAHDIVDAVVCPTQIRIAVLEEELVVALILRLDQPLLSVRLYILVYQTDNLVLIWERSLYKIFPESFPVLWFEISLNCLIIKLLHIKNIVFDRLRTSLCEARSVVIRALWGSESLDKD